MGVQLVEVAVAGHGDFGSEAAQVVTDEVGDGGMFGRFFRVGQQALASIGQRGIHRTFHGMGIDKAIGYPDKDFGREHHKAVVYPQPVGSTGMVEHLPQGEVGIDGGSTSVVYQEGIAAMQVTVYDVESATVLLKAHRMRLPAERNGARSSGHSLRHVRGFRKGKQQFRRRQTVGFFHQAFLGGIIYQEKERAAFATKAVHAGDGFLTATKREGISHFVWF